MWRSAGWRGPIRPPARSSPAFPVSASESSPNLESSFSVPLPATSLPIHARRLPPSRSASRWLPRPGVAVPERSRALRGRRLLDFIQRRSHRPEQLRGGVRLVEKVTHPELLQGDGLLRQQVSARDNHFHVGPH